MSKKNIEKKDRVRITEEEEGKIQTSLYYLKL